MYLLSGTEEQCISSIRSKNIHNIHVLKRLYVGLGSAAEVEAIYRSRMIELVRKKYQGIENEKLIPLMNLEEDVIKEIEDDPKTGHPRVIFKSMSEIEETKTISEEDELSHDITRFLHDTLYYPKDCDTRLVLFQLFIECFKNSPVASIRDITEYILKNQTIDCSRDVVKRFVFALGEERAMKFVKADEEYTLYTHPQEINEGLENAVEVEAIYCSRIIELVRRKYQGIEDEKLIQLMNLEEDNSW